VAAREDPPVTKPGDQYLKLILEELREIRSSLKQEKTLDPDKGVTRVREGRK
jgi:hypothetical protein